MTPYANWTTTAQNSKQFDRLNSEKSDNLKVKSLASISYDIRTQLNGIIGMSQVLLQSEDINSYENEDIKIILESGKRLLVLFDDIMNMSKTETREAKACDWSGYTVLIVEDDIVNLKVLGGMLRKTKVNIIHSDNGVKAVEQVRSNPQIDLVLMDIQLPEMNGFEATGKIHVINPTLPVIAQTTKEQKKCLEAGCIDYISKPVDKGELFNKMSKFLTDK